MRTVTFKSILYGVARRLGEDPAVNLQSNQAASITDYINTQVRRAWEYYEWPELMLLEQRYYRADWDSGTTYAAGDEVYSPSQEAYYTSLQGSNLNNAVTDTDYWEVATDLDPYIELEATGQTVIGEILEAWNKDPRIYRTAKRVNWWLYADKIQIELPAPTSTWIYFRQRPNEFTSTAYDNSASYSVDDLVYYSTTGECYISIQAGSGNLPTDTSYWTKLDFPYIFKHYVTEAAFAEALAEDEQGGKAEKAADIAEGYLMDEMEKVGRQQRQIGNVRVRGW